MLAAMAFAAIYCIALGVNPSYLYAMLPYEVNYHPYSLSHVMQSYQILLFTMLGFFLVIKKLYPEPKIGLDLDWFYRKGSGYFIAFCRLWPKGRYPPSSTNHTIPKNPASKEVHHSGGCLFPTEKRHPAH